MTKISKNKKELILYKYKEYEFCAEQHKLDGNIHMHEIYIARLEEIRMMLFLLEIYIDGINQEEKKGE